MYSTLWALLGAGALLWPSRTSGPLDGVPLDQPAEVILFGALLPLVALASPATLRRTTVHAAIIALLAWKAFGAIALVQDGWCVRFETPAPLSRDMGLVPHSWDARADWRSPEPRCSAIVDRRYAFLEAFPIWFYNLPPASHHAASDADRPPLVRLRMTVSGVLTVGEPGVLRLGTGEDMQTALTIDGVDHGQVRDGDVQLTAGEHHVTMTADMSGGRWRFEPSWNGNDLWPQAIATVDRLSALDTLVRPWSRAVPLVLVLTLIAIALADLWRGLGAAGLWLPSTAVLAFAAVGRMSGAAVRAVPLLLAGSALLVPPSLRNTRGFLLLIAAPWLAWFGVRAANDAAVITFYTSGDDWWMFQRFAYRIVMQGYWLEGGQVTFWYQPLYRWIAGTLHMIFGDSSAGELLWDAWCVLAGAWFTFATVRAFAGVRWAFGAAAVMLLIFTIGPAWFLFGRGLSEISSMGFLSAAALLLVYGRQRSTAAIVAAGLFAILAFYTRLNNLPAVLAVTAFALPVSVPLADVWRPRSWFAQISKPVVLSLVGAIAVGMWLFAWRTYYYTGELDMLYGTQAGALAAWQYTTEGLTPFQNISGSLLMVLFMSDPPRFDVRALPILLGVGAAVLGAIGVPLFRRLPLNVAVLSLACAAGSLIARGSAYPGRFSVHIIPPAVALAACVAALVFDRRRETPE